MDYHIVYTQTYYKKPKRLTYNKIMVNAINVYRDSSITKKIKINKCKNHELTKI